MFNNGTLSDQREQRLYKFTSVSFAKASAGGVCSSTEFPNDYLNSGSFGLLPSTFVEPDRITKPIAAASLKEALEKAVTPAFSFSFFDQNATPAFSFGGAALGRVQVHRAGAQHSRLGPACRLRDLDACPAQTTVRACLSKMQASWAAGLFEK